MNECQLSIIIPCHNYGRYLSEAIESVLNQKSSIEHMEVIVVDDHSSDQETLDTLSRWKGASPRVRVLSNHGRSGAAAARNFGINAANGEWIAFLDADDIWTPDGLQARWKVVETYPDAKWIGADLIRWYEDGTFDKEGHFVSTRFVRQLLSNANNSDGVLKLSKPIREYLQMHLGSMGTIMVKKMLLTEVGGFEQSLEQYEDHHLWLRLACKADFFFVPKVVAIYRQHGMSLSHVERPPSKWYIEALRMLLQDAEFRPYASVIKHQISCNFDRNVYYHRARGEIRLAISAGLNAIRYHPRNIACWRILLGALLGRR